MDIHGEQEKDTSDVEFLDEDPKAMNSIWILHRHLLLQSIYTEQIDGSVPANLEVIGDASSIPQYLFSLSSILQSSLTLMPNMSSTEGKNTH